MIDLPSAEERLAFLMELVVEGTPLERRLLVQEQMTRLLPRFEREMENQMGIYTAEELEWLLAVAQNPLTAAILEKQPQLVEAGRALGTRIVRAATWASRRKG